MDDPELVGAGGDETQLRVTAAIRAGSRWQELEHVWAEATEHQQVVERAVIELIAELESLPGALEAAPAWADHVIESFDVAEVEREIGGFSADDYVLVITRERAHGDVLPVDANSDE